MHGRERESQAFVWVVLGASDVTGLAIGHVARARCLEHVFERRGLPALGQAHSLSQQGGHVDELAVTPPQR